MTRYDIYDQQLNPGDYICCIRKNELVAAKIQSISVKGTIRIREWKPIIRSYSTVITQQMKGYRIIKIAGLPAQT